MFNLIKMNFFRLFHMKSFYILLGLSALLSLLALYLFKFMLGMSAAIEAGADVEMDIVTTAMEAVITLPELFDFILSFLLLFCGLGAAFLAHAEYKNGFIKNIAGQVFPRGIQAIAKIPVLLFEIAAISAAFLLVFLLYALFRESVVVGSVPVLLETISVRLLLLLAFDSVILLLTTLTKRSTLGIILTIFSMTNLLNLVYTLINYTLHKYLHVPASFDIADFALDTYVRQISSESEGALIARGLAASAVYLAICTLASFMVIKKRDV